MNNLNKPFFSTISTIRIENTEYYADTLYLTFDIDWACDEVLADTIDLVEEAGVHATWFVTHDTTLLSRLRNNPKFELGIHPNFNSILMGKPDSVNGKNAEGFIERLLAIVPEAKSIRSHSMTQSSNLLQLFCDKGLTHDCNHFIPHQAGIEPLKPWYLWNGLIKVPYFWEDDASVIYGENLNEIGHLLVKKGLKVFDFHPIHVFLNTEKIERYEETRDFHRSPEKPLSFCNEESFGTRSALMKLLGLQDSFERS